jgi:predicted nucleotidyltransferase component of viral defense system
MQSKTLTAVQSQVVELFFSQDLNLEHQLFLTGGTALSEFHFQHRLSFDLDFFVRIEPGQRVDFSNDAEILVNLLKGAGLKVRPGQRSKSKVRLEVENADGESTLVDLCCDDGPHLQELRRIGPYLVDSIEDMTSRKVMAFFERGEQEAKDAVDLFYLLTKGHWTLPELIQLASKKSLDFEDSDALLHLANLLVHCRNEDYVARMKMLLFPEGEQPDLDHIADRLALEGQQLFASLRPSA